MTTTEISIKNTDRQIKKAYAKKYGLSVNSVKILRTSITKPYDVFTGVLGVVLKEEGYDFTGTQCQMNAITEMYNKVVCRLGIARILEGEDFMIELTPNTDGVEIFKIEVNQQGKGLGTNLMNIMMDISEELNIPLYLKPVPYKNTTVEQLRKFYHNLGFRRCCKNEYWSNF
jgi:GNAT superfamily N-acetyltransferase